MQSADHNGVGIVYWFQINSPKQCIFWLHEHVENIIYGYRTYVSVCKRVQKIPVRFRIFDFEHTRQYTVANAQNTKTDEIVLHQQFDTVGVSGCHNFVRSPFVD